jgi:transcriptional regulator with XRE-family HTH domain
MQTETEKSLPETAAVFENTSSVRDQLLDNFIASKVYRHAFVEEKVRTGIAAQIKVIRERRGMKRPEFASLMGKAPSWVFRLEDPNQTPPTIPTLLQVAEAFDVDLNISFESFSQLLDCLDGMTPESFEVPSFNEEMEADAFREHKPEPKPRGRKLHRIHHVSRNRDRHKSSTERKPAGSEHRPVTQNTTLWTQELSGQGVNRNNSAAACHPAVVSGNESNGYCRTRC